MSSIKLENEFKETILFKKQYKPLFNFVSKRLDGKALNTWNECTVFKKVAVIDNLVAKGVLDV